MSNTLLPCPFCGGEATIQQDTRYPRYGKKDTVKAYEPICINPNCLIYKADSIYFLSEKEAIAAWNRRTQRRAQDARNELCLKCGRYREAHNGACDNCKWKEI